MLILLIYTGLYWLIWSKKWSKIFRVRIQQFCDFTGFFCQEGAMKVVKNKKLKNLPRGEGSMYYLNDATLEYKKTIVLRDGRRKRVSVRGASDKECFEKMELKEKKLNESIIPDNKKTLVEAMNEWHNTFKMNKLKPQADYREFVTINSSIGRSEIGNLKFQIIQPDQIQRVLNIANYEWNYSHSTIKKMYDTLNEFYRYASLKYEMKNPMLYVSMIRPEKVLKEPKEMAFFDEEDIVAFLEECSAKYKSGRRKYRYGLVCAANIFMGLRGGELLALQWKDIDFDKKLIYVHKTLILKKNPKYKEGGREPKKVLDIQNYTKTNKNRYVPLNNKALEYLLQYREESDFTDQEDFLIMTQSGKLNSLQHLSNSIKKITKSSNTKVKTGQTHCMRHTCASLMFKNNVKIEVICRILGNSRAVCEKTYIHFVEEQLRDAIANIIPKDLFDKF